MTETENCVLSFSRYTVLPSSIVGRPVVIHWSMARAATRAIVVWGNGLRHERTGHGSPEQNGGGPVYTGPYQNRIINIRVEPEEDVG